MNHLIIALFTLTVLGANAQEVGITDWQRMHPDVTFIEATEFAQMSDDKKALIGDNIIVFNEQIKAVDIEIYEASHQSKSTHQLTDPKEEADYGEFIKRWRANHSDVKIVRRSHFNAMDPAKQALYVETGAMILQNELITYQDIIDYESTH